MKALLTGRGPGLLVACMVAAMAVATAEARPARPAHTRLTTAQGPIHLWTPAGYDRATAGIVIYVHGFYTTVDRAWREHRLARQFAASGLNALFIACEAPASGKEPIRWPSVNALLDAVAAVVPPGLPEGRIIAVGHSGAHLTLTEWVREDRLDTVVLVDAVFGNKPQFAQWLDRDPNHRLIDAAALSRPWSEPLHAQRADAVVFERFPRKRSGLASARAARLVYVRSQFDHMELVTEGIALPMLLRATNPRSAPP